MIWTTQDLLHRALLLLLQWDLWLIPGDAGGAVGLIGGDRGGGAVGALTVELGDVAVLTDGAGALVIVGFKTLFEAFRRLKPILEKQNKYLFPISYFISYQ